MALADIFNRALDLATQAYDFFFEEVIGLPGYRDVWVTTSGHPCVFCRYMEQLSHQVVIKPGGAFPVPNTTIQAYLTAQQLTFVESPPAHEHCQCERQTIPRT